MSPFRPIPGFPGYLACRCGRIIGRNDTPLKPWEVTCPTRPATTYLKVGLYVNRKRRRMFVQRLVLLAFQGEPPPGFEDACHTNGDAHDNRIENLVWDSHANNNAHAHSDDNLDSLATRMEREGLLDGVADVRVEGVPF